MRPFSRPSGDGVPALPLQQPQALHPDPGRQRSGEEQMGGPPQRAPPHPQEEQAEGALRLRPQGGLRQHPAAHQDDTVRCYHRWAFNTLVLDQDRKNSEYVKMSFLCVFECSCSTQSYFSPAAIKMLDKRNILWPAVWFSSCYENRNKPVGTFSAQNVLFLALTWPSHFICSALRSRACRPGQ